MKTEQKINQMMPSPLTKRQWKRKKGSSTPGKDKGENCHATSLDKAMAKNPRSYKTHPDDYNSWVEKKSRYQK